METLTLDNGGTGKIYGTFDAGVTYIKSRLGDQYTAFLALDTDGQRQALISATARLNREGYTDAAATFALRDAIVAADPDMDNPFQAACYELAAAAADDADVLTTLDQGSNIQQVEAGGAGVTYFVPQSKKQGTAPLLPPIVMDLIGAYLSGNELDGPDGGDGQSGSSENPFDCEHSMNRMWPF